MTPNTLIKHLQDLPSELMDVDMEYMIKITDYCDHFFIEEEYIGGIVFNDDDKTVKLCSSKILDEFSKAVGPKRSSDAPNLN